MSNISKDNEICFYINKDIYKINTIMKTAYNFIDNYYVFLDYCDNGKIKIVLQYKDACNRENLEKCKGEFLNELLRQNVRYIISKETKNIREILMGKALYDTCIEYDNNECEEVDSQDINITDNMDIFMNWFDKDEE